MEKNNNDRRVVLIPVDNGGEVLYRVLLASECASDVLATHASAYMSNSYNNHGNVIVDCLISEATPKRIPLSMEEFVLYAEDNFGKGLGFTLQGIRELNRSYAHFMNSNITPGMFVECLSIREDGVLTDVVLEESVIGPCPPVKFKGFKVQKPVNNIDEAIIRLSSDSIDIAFFKDQIILKVKLPCIGSGHVLSNGRRVEKVSDLKPLFKHLEFTEVAYQDLFINR